MQSSPERSGRLAWRWLLLLAVGGVASAAEPTFYAARVAPVMDRHCVVCHGPEKKKAGLRLDSFEHLMAGAESGGIVKPGDLKGSELHRRITLPASDEEVMPSDGKPLLSADEIKIIALWIEGGASVTKSLAEFPNVPALRPARVAPVRLAPDWREKAAEIAALEKKLGVKLVPRSQIPTDGLVLRTASAPQRGTDQVLAELAPVTRFVVDAELARTPVTDAGLKILARWENLRAIDLTRTKVTSGGLAALAGLKQLEVINLTDTAVDDAGVTTLRAIPGLKRAWLFGSKASVTEFPVPKR
jgi:mono/diheme cytochrome c family protein